MSEMTCRFGTVIQDYYLDKVRSVNARRDARFAAIQTREDALDYIAEVREKIAAAFPMPEERGVTPEVVVTSAREYDKFRMECVIYYSRPGYPVTANLYLPKVEGKVPAVIVACGHSPNGKARDFYSKAGITFAEMGYAALVVDPVGQGERWQFVNVPDAFEVDGRCTHEHNMTGKLLSLTGEFFGAWRVYDLIRGLDYLLSLPQVDASRVGITGTSGGGTLTAFTQALEPRFTMAAPSCYITSWQRNIENEIPADIEQMPPGLLAEGLEMGDLLLPLAPRPILILGQDNDFFDPRGTVETYQRLKKIYELQGCPENLQCFIGEGEHGLSADHRREIYNFFNLHAGIAASTDESPLMIPEADLLCTPTGQLMTSYPEAETLYSWTVKKAEELTAGRPQLATAEVAEKLREALKVPAEVPVPYSRKLRNETFFDAENNASFLSRFALESEEKMLTILKLYGPKEYFAVPQMEEADLYVAHLDATDELFTAPRSHNPLFLLDVRGIGELAPAGCDLYEQARPYTWQYGADYHYNSLAYMLNEPMLGKRVQDILSAIAFLKDRGIKVIHLKANGLGTIPAAMAALFSDCIADVNLIGAPKSYLDMVRSRVCWCPASCMLPGILEFTDLPEIYEAVSEAKTLVFTELQDNAWTRRA